ncbi:hypothetical protein NL676_018321 [Syzygium grande]|nr:hypothetical protein NL676_018321 [Syzygium grande]
MLGKVQSETTTMPIRRTKAGVEEFAPDVTPKSHKESPISAMGVRRVSRNLKHSPGLSPKVQSTISPKCGEKSLVKADDGAKECDASVQHADSGEVLTNIGSKAYSKDQADQFGPVKELAVEIFSPSLSDRVSENPCSISGQVDVLNSDLFPSNSSTTDVMASTRIPFSVVDSLYNRDGSNDVSAGLRIVEVEKRATLPSPGDITSENR